MHNQHNHRKPKLPIRLWLGEIRKFGNRAIGGLKRSLLGNWLNMNRGDRQRVEGFVLPTVTMVMLVVVLLTVAIAFRALDRAQFAQNVRVSQEVLLAATPALERASAKLDQAFESIGRAAPAEHDLIRELREERYNFGVEGRFDREERLTLEFDGRDIDTAWGFKEDLNGDGDPDRYNIYGIFLRSPENDNDGLPKTRTPVEARGLPLPKLGSKLGSASPNYCQDDSSTGLSVAGTDWYQARGGLLEKPFFIYSASIPVSGRGFAAVEMQEDRRAEPITVNAVVYEGDLDITPGQELRLNGRIMVNGNLVHVNTNNARINYYQVSSPASESYKMELGKIVVGGNVGFGQASLNQDSRGRATVHLFRPGGHDEVHFTRENKPVNAFPNQMVTNQLEYAERISGLVFEQKCKSADTDPDEVKEAVEGGTDRLIALENYFRARTRRVPNVEEEDYTAPDWEHPQGCNQTYDRRTEGSGNDLRPVDRWIYPYNIRGGDATQSIPTVPLNGLALNGSGNKLNIPATHPDIVRENQRETRVGDRILVGNGLPARWYDSNRIGDNKFHGEATAQFIEGKEWDEAPSGESVRFRQTRMFDMPDLGDTGRNGFWERAAAEEWKEPHELEPGEENKELVGGLRVVTGAGIYWDEGSFLPPPKGGRDVVWPDTMPMGWDDPFDDPDKGYQKGHLKMRATVVYHYTKTPWEERGDRQEPIACISSYYDPTFYRSSTDNTGKNKSGLPWDSSAQGQSENGIVYAAQIEDIGRLTPSATPHNPYDVQSGGTGGEDTPTAATLEQKLQYQASLRFPDGRWVNEPLRVAIEKSPGDRTLADQSAIDAAVCAIKIMTGEAGTPRPDIIDHGTIYERTLLDGRQVKSLEDGDGFFADGKGTYDRAIEDRQPLEIRTTVIDLDKLRQKAIDTDEFLLPNSGIIYATRDDALRDDSTGDRITSPVDFVVDETRRPNGIMLINGQRLDRPQGNRRERGLILVSNLPVYVKGNFNLHQTPGGTPLQEFTETLNANWSNFYERSTPDPNFACPPQDQWRPATVLSDAVTLLSDAFREGFRNEGDYNLRNNMVLSLDYRNRRNLQPVKLQDGYDFRQGVTQFDESHFDFDLDGDGDQDDEDVGPNDLTLEAVRRLNGFYDNNFVTSASIWIPNRVGMWMDGASQERSSYLTNFVTPVQTRRGTEGIEYVMEMCRKPLVSMCNPEDWVVSRQNPATPEYASDKIGENFIYSNNDDTPTVGTTVQRILPSWERIYPRRIAFLRDRTHKLVLDKEGHPIPLGVVNGKYDYSPLQNAEICLDSDGKISLITEGESEGEYDRNCENGTMVPRVTTKKADALRFQMDGDVPKVRWEPNNESPDDVLYAQPMWEPVVQLNTVDSASGERWLQTPRSNTTFNLIIASGDSPIRQTNGNETELNGGLHNFTRFLEMWPGRTVNISGSFIQFKHSAYATGPMMSVLNQDSAHLTKFGPPLTSGNRPYRSANDNGQTTFYGAPNRNYGYDVGRMIFLPDLFDSRLVTPSTEPTDKYFREVSRDDPWVHTLLCGREGENGPNFLPDGLRPAECPLDPDRFFGRT
ncbi:hormogonium polysaccharide biosynthesis protein HpsA [Limnospira sp. PMC 1249.20]|uniref:hormogonium polysaccharide biosynthesis protein HpsA n=1 Tax=Limnospira sp. PMC 1249.20 TaxID=2981047 RepID=UPI0028E12E3E|nr:hormogonium polysaccharide biosynthesis protein HpsA [Limnospira sp. PMC 1249.20]MDT9242687.1 hormogonium polysaccharide biosynthesis protein HpsA [Limnospira sp. PMC 1249.20]